jgi:adenylate cyclase
MSRPDKAVEVLQESAEHAEFRPLIVAVQGAAHGRNGQRDKALEMLELLRKHAGENYLLPSYAAMIFLGLGEYERVFENLEHAFERRNFWLVFLKADPFYDIIRGYPEYRTLLKKLKLE